MRYSFRSPGAKLPVSLAPGDLKLYRIQDADGEPFTIEYYLDK
jgi:hypothetical protein